VGALEKSPASREGPLESTFRRLLGLKTAAQYQSAPISRTDATQAVDWATRIVDVAVDVAGAEAAIESLDACGSARWPRAAMAGCAGTRRHGPR